MTALFALPLVASLLMTPGAQTASIAPNGHSIERTGKAIAPQLCRSKLISANQVLDDRAVRYDRSNAAPAVMLLTVDVRVDGCEMIVPVGREMRPLPKPPEPDSPDDLFHRAAG